MKMWYGGMELQCGGALWTCVEKIRKGARREI